MVGTYHGPVLAPLLLRVVLHRPRRPGSEFSSRVLTRIGAQGLSRKPFREEENRELKAGQLTGWKAVNEVFPAKMLYAITWATTLVVPQKCFAGFPYIDQGQVERVLYSYLPSVHLGTVPILVLHINIPHVSMGNTEQTYQRQDLPTTLSNQFTEY